MQYISGIFSTCTCTVHIADGSFGKLVCFLTSGGSCRNHAHQVGIATSLALEPVWLARLAANAAIPQQRPSNVSPVITRPEMLPSVFSALLGQSAQLRGRPTRRSVPVDGKNDRQHLYEGVHSNCWDICIA